ncbi:MAG: hypothetical protein KAS32_04275 [Candidatus Peribacteraceae bacterium]|nr:hypothetical protein [Candidatus Peribacteraceae bacterium]
MITKLKYWIARKRFKKWVRKVVFEQRYGFKRQNREWNKLISETTGVSDFMIGLPHQETATTVWLKHMEHQRQLQTKRPSH